MSIRYTSKEFLEKAKEVHGDKYDYSKVEYKNINEKIIIICPIHGEFEQKPSKHLSGQGCPKCANKDRVAKKMMTTDEFILQSKKIHGDRYDYSKVECNGLNNKVTIICREHGEFEQKPSKHLLGQGCPKCANNIKQTTEDFIIKARKVHGDKYSYNKSFYRGRHKKLTITCPIHGDFEQTPSDHLRGRGCRLCGNDHKREILSLSQEQAIEKIMLGTKNRYKLADDFNYVNELTKVKLVCPIHGVFESYPKFLYNGHGCPKCGAIISHKEEEVAEYVKSLLEKRRVERNKRGVLESKQKELDIYIPSLKIAIEFNGILWHSEAYNKDKNYHLNKLNECNKRGIRLIHIFEDEWNFRKDIVKSKLRHILGKDDGEIIYARKCLIKDIDVKSAKEFLNVNHIQGFVSSSIYLGAFYNGRLVGVMSLTQERKDEWNLTRFAYDINTRCIGLYGKMFHHFLKTYNPKEVKSFADRRWTTSSEDNAYTKIGFKLDEVLPPEYRYVVDGRREHKFKFRKDRIHKKYGLSLDMTEKEMTRALGFYRIWDCGLFKYVWSKDFG